MVNKKPVPHGKIDARELKFCEIFLNQPADRKNVYQAAIEAGYAPTTAKVNSHKILLRDRVQEYLRERVKPADNELALTFDRKVEKLATLVKWGIPTDGREVNPVHAKIAIMAINEINKMQGHYAAEKHVNVNINADTDIKALKELAQNLLEQHKKEY
jgi:phage terminase small subunit